MIQYEETYPLRKWLQHTNTKICIKYHSYEILLVYEKNLFTHLIESLYMMRQMDKYPASDGISLYNFQKLPVVAMINVNDIATIQVGNNIL